MKIQELITELQSILEKRGNIDVICSEDQEGNGYNEARGVDFVYADSEYEYVYGTLSEFKEEDGGTPQKAALIYV